MKIRSYFVSALVPALIGLALGELLMTRMFVLFQPTLGAMTFITVEVVGAFLIDFSLACLSAFVFAKKQPQAGPRGGIFAGAAFVTTFLLFIVLMVVLRQFTSAIDLFGLYDSLSVAVRTAREGFGRFFPVMVLTFLAFEYLLCMLGGLVGFYLSTDGVGVKLDKQP